MLRCSQMFLAVLLVLFGPVAAANTAPALIALEKNWGVLNFVKPSERDEAKLLALAERAKQVADQYVALRAEALALQALVLSTYADTNRRFSALRAVEKARDALQESIRLKPHHEYIGLAYGLLGSIYYQVPGRPIAWGNKKIGAQYLDQAVKIAPDNLDVIYFYAEYLRLKGAYREAVAYLERGLRLPIHPDRQEVDAARKSSLRVLLRDTLERF